ncbi:hypothetical protein JTB14_030465 [Gonioctena quinquepunctata]|nr:hypothetical protein JTB14_030465 [Gonioctena quinquepunctata]
MLETSSQQIMDGISDWFIAYKLSINIEKTHNIISQLYQNKPEMNILLDEKPICSQDSTKFSELLIDEELDWSSQMIQLNLKLRTCFHYVP